MDLPQELNRSLCVELISSRHVQIVHKINEDLGARQAKYILCLFIDSGLYVPLHAWSIGVTVKVYIGM